MNSIIKKPILTEKAMSDSELKNRFTFVVDRRANKIEIKDAVQKLYGVSVEKVRTMTYGGGKRRTKNTAKGIVQQAVPVWKKAIVTVAEGETIDLFENN